MTKVMTALKNLAAKLTNKQASQVTGKTIDEVISFAATNFKIAEATTAYALVLQSPDESIWDVSIANNGTISATKRT